MELKTGTRIGRLLLKTAAYEPRTTTGIRYWLWICDCDCGTKGHKVLESSFKRRTAPTQSCGCYQRECVSKRSRKHGERGWKDRKITPEYETWCHMRRRCLSKDSADYKRYGGRGIKICEEWNVYETFLKDMGRRPTKSHSIDRIDNDGDYTPKNCKWSTKKEQNRNRRSNRKLTIDGVTKLIVEWAEASGVRPINITNRLKLGWTPKEAVFTKERSCRKQST